MVKRANLRTDPTFAGCVILFTVVAGLIFLAGCTGADKNPDPSSATTTHPSGLQVTLNGPSIIEQESPWDASYEANVENHGPKPIAFAVHPIWLKLEVFTPDGKKVKALHFNEVDWNPPDRPRPCDNKARRETDFQSFLHRQPRAWQMG